MHDGLRSEEPEHPRHVVEVVDGAGVTGADVGEVHGAFVEDEGQVAPSAATGLIPRVRRPPSDLLVGSVFRTVREVGQQYPGEEGTPVTIHDALEEQELKR